MSCSTSTLHLLIGEEMDTHTIFHCQKCNRPMLKINTSANKKISIIWDRTRELYIIDEEICIDLKKVDFIICSECEHLNMILPERKTVDRFSTDEELQNYLNSWKFIFMCIMEKFDSYFQRVKDFVSGSSVNES